MGPPGPPGPQAPHMPRTIIPRDVLDRVRYLEYLFCFYFEIHLFYYFLYSYIYFYGLIFQGEIGPIGPKVCILFIFRCF